MFTNGSVVGGKNMDNKKANRSKSDRAILKAVGCTGIVIIMFITAMKLYQNRVSKAANFVSENVPDIRYPYTKEYEPGTGNIKGDVDVESFEKISGKFAIGANADGYAVFKDPDAAFVEMEKRYADGIKRIQEEFDLQPLTKINYISYENLGCQVTTGTEDEQMQAAFVSGFLDIYGSSYVNPGEYLWAVIDEVTETGLNAYVINEMVTSINLDSCSEELAAYDIIEVQYEIDDETALAKDISVSELTKEQISELSAADWEYEEINEDGIYHMYAIVQERADNMALVCELKNSDAGQRIHISSEVLEASWEADSDECPESGSIICINYNTGSEYEYGDDAISLSEVSSIGKLY